jgi:TRAP-type uncharacterized transport system substrate-binding protein
MTRRHLLATAALLPLISPLTANAQRAPVPEIKLCTGPEGGNYDFAGIQIKRQGQGVVNVRLPSNGTKGSLDNLELLASGACDAAIVQSDAYGVYMKQHQGASLNLERGRVLYPEYAHLICNKEAGLSKITGLKKGMTVLTGPNGGGAGVTWDSFKLADPKRYGEIATLPIGGKRGLGLVDEGKDATCLLYVAGLNATSMQEADDFAEKSGHLTLVPTNDSDLPGVKDPKGRPVYETAEIPAGTYPHAFQTRHLTGSSVGAVSVQAIVVGNVPFIEANEKTYDGFLTAVNKAMPAILEHVSGGRK